MVVHASSPSYLGGWGRRITRSTDRDHPGQNGETPSLLKIQKISWAWWRVPVIPATQEAEAGELLEPRRQRLWWSEIAPLLPSWATRVNLHLKNITISFAQWQYRSQWGLSEARLLLIENFSQYPAMTTWNTVGTGNFSQYTETD